MEAMVHLLLGLWLSVRFKVIEESEKAESGESKHSGDTQESLGGDAAVSS